MKAVLALALLLALVPRPSLADPAPKKSSEITERAKFEVAPTGKGIKHVTIENALGRLPPGYRAILVLHDVEGLSHEECAAILECRVGTCKSQLHKARARMRELLGPIGGRA